MQGETELKTKRSIDFCLQNIYKIEIANIWGRPARHQNELTWLASYCRTDIQLASRKMRILSER